MSTIDLLPNVTSFSIGVILMALSSVFAVIHRALERYRDPLREVPGPFLARWTSLWLAYQVRMGRRYLVVDALHKVSRDEVNRNLYLIVHLTEIRALRSDRPQPCLSRAQGCHQCRLRTGLSGLRQVAVLSCLRFGQSFYIFYRRSSGARPKATPRFSRIFVQVTDERDTVATFKPLPFRRQDR